MSLIKVSNLTFAYDGAYNNIFENASFQIDTSWRLGFVGRNGRGKTTFLRLLVGEHEYKGRIDSSVEFEYFPYYVRNTDRTTHTVMSEIAPHAHDWEYECELNKLQVSPEILYRDYNTLSHGERTKVLLCAMFLRENSFLLIDEPTNHLDVYGRECLSAYLRSKIGFILVSHDRRFLDGCVNYILSINRANIEVQRGTFSSWYENKSRQDAYEMAENARLEREISSLEDAARQSHDWADKVESTKIGKKSGEDMKNARSYAGEQSRRMQQRRKNLERRQSAAIDEKRGLLKNIERQETLKIHPMPYRKELLLSLTDVSIGYDEHTVCSGVTFSVHRGSRIALSGGNGCGKSSVLRLLLGNIQNNMAVTGRVEIGSGLIISYVPQSTDGLSGNVHDYARIAGIDETLFMTILRKFDFPRVQFEKDLSELSAGQKKKILIACSLAQEAHLYIWDEPLNYIDVLSRIQIENLIHDFQPTMIFVEHDAAFRENTATEIITLAGADAKLHDS